MTVTHRLSRTREYKSWLKMKERCFNPNATQYKWYGGKGITVCDRWKSSFENFLADMGKRPSPSHSIDRIDSSGNYEPDNCRWADRKTQIRNQSKTKWIYVGGQKVILAEYAESLGISCDTLTNRLRSEFFNGDILSMKDGRNHILRHELDRYLELKRSMTNRQVSEVMGVSVRRVEKMAQLIRRGKYEETPISVSIRSNRSPKPLYRRAHG